MFVVGALFVMVAGALVLDITLTNTRRGLIRSEGVWGWAAMGLAGFAVAVVGFVLASMAASNLAIETLHISVPPMAGNPLYPLLGGLRGVGEECLLRGLRLPGFAERVPLQFQGL